LTCTLYATIISIVNIKPHGNHSIDKCSWARIYGEDLVIGQDYHEQKLVICLSLMDGDLPDAESKPIKKIQALFHVIERDTHELL